MNTSKKLLAGMAAIIAVVVGVAAYKAADKESDEANGSPSPSATVITEITPTPVVRRYKDGTYTAVGEYSNPAGGDKIDVTLILKDDIVVDAIVVSTTTHPTSKKMQTQFISGYKALVIGKKIDDVVLTKVSGSSLTPVGFNNAVAKIKVQAS